MSKEGEHKITDTQGKFLQVVKSGRKLNDPDWTSGRVLLSNKRIVLAGNQGKRSIPLSDVKGLKGRYDVNQAVASVSDYLSVEFDDNVILIGTNVDIEEFETDLYGALLNQKMILTKHPAVEGGVVQDTNWEKARVKITDGMVNVAIASGTFVGIELDDIGSVERATRTVKGEQRTVLEVEHTQGDTSVQTYVSGQTRRCALLESLFQKGERKNEGGVELDEVEKEVLMALYSGVSPFEIPGFLGMEVDEVESIFERLIEVDVLEEVRKRREVSLKTRGRNIASESINEK
ncbi:CheF family chemotaxis protein [Halorussus sp. MSC15.2]|uniref:CheF family chemotaxis protein n=1 Tax=Halorussus sp. MSC15.2 TaxID=2283638 RepID=UPI0013D0048A|nr:CheF family chemotaxis protein [Halorussus sp. MSC15.2]NEU56497.1 chemotaxis protein CheF1 [Halorussus sp. MSC15.2]